METKETGHTGPGAVLFLVAFAWSLGDLRASGVADLPFPYDVDLKLAGALVRSGVNASGKQELRPKDLLLHLGIRDGQWSRRVLGYAGYTSRGVGVIFAARAYNAMDHEGRILEVTDLPQAPGTVRLSVDMTIHADPWVPGGPARYLITLAKQGHSLRGTFSGTFQDHPVAGKVAGEIRTTLWPAPMAGHAALAPGEHPRLIFRKHDLPALRKRMETAEGKAILQRLEQMLKGPWTLWHGAGYGFLYQLTGEAKYADLARQCVDDAVTGRKTNPDVRYSFFKPGHGGKMRAGPSYAAVAMAYDLCYDGWAKAYRERLARAIQDKIYNPGVKPSSNDEHAVGDLTFNPGPGQYDPGSNHYGAWQGGGGTATLAILGDPGTDNETVQRCHRLFIRRAKRALEVGFTKRGYFHEGLHQCGRISANTGLTTYLQALRVAEGKDLVANCEAAQWICTKWVYELAVRKGRILSLERGMYAREFSRDGGNTSESGDFSQGLGICPESHKPAVLWFLNHILDPDPATRTYDAIKYPHHAVYAFVNWPIGMQEKNPSEVLGHVLADPEAEYFVLRSGWKGEEDIVATLEGGIGMITGGGFEENPKFQRKWGPGGRICPMWYLVSLSTAPRREGDCYIAYGGSAATVIDSSGLAGAPMVVVTVSGIRPPPASMPASDDDDKLVAKMKARFGRGGGAERRFPRPLKPEIRIEPVLTPRDDLPWIMTQRRWTRDHDFRVLSFQRGPAPPTKAIDRDGEQALIVGKRKISIEDGQIVPGKSE